MTTCAAMLLWLLAQCPGDLPVAQGGPVQTGASAVVRPGPPVMPAATHDVIRHRTRPWIHPTVGDDVAAKLDKAIEIANRRVAEVPACAKLFSRLGADGCDTLEAVLYLPASPREEAGACRHALAHTFVGDSRTWVCRSITSVSDSQAAMVLIHEALHHAGLPEARRGRAGATSSEINEMISVRCRL